MTHISLLIIKFFGTLPKSVCDPEWRTVCTFGCGRKTNKQSFWTENGGSRKRLVLPSGQLHSRSPGKRLRPTVFLSPHNKPLLLFPGKPRPWRPGCRSNTHGLVWCVVSTIKVGQLGAQEQVNSTGQNQHSEWPQELHTGVGRHKEETC